MSDDSSPYVPPRDPFPSAIPEKMAAPAKRPVAVTVFGAMHLAFGLFTGARLLGPSLGYRMPHLVYVHGIPEFSMRVSQSSWIRSQVNHEFPWLAPLVKATGDALAILLVVAGVTLLMRHKKAIRWANAYAWFFIGQTLAFMLLSIFLLGPAYREAYARNGAKVTASQSTAGSYIAQALIMASYPVLSLILLNRPRIKAWFANSTPTP